MSSVKLSMSSAETDKKNREIALNDWAREMLARSGVTVKDDFRLFPASDDASFRRYFRGVVGEGSFIFVDAPPDREDSRPFVQVAGLLREAGLSAPEVLQKDLAQGFMMLTDFGDRLYLEQVESAAPQVEALYRDAVEGIVSMQRLGSPAGLPFYSEVLLREEMNLFTDWLLPGQLALDISSKEERLIADVFDLMVENALEQPAAFVHRDYHSRNLMILDQGNPGILDFQDAVVGPVTYDLVSLLRDCYHRFPPTMVADWVETFRLRLIDEQMLGKVSPNAFMRWFDLMGMQRHIKVAGIFSRLNLRDGKPRYLADIPRVVSYISEVCGRYEELRAFGRWLDRRIVPELNHLV